MFDKLLESICAFCEKKCRYDEIICVHCLDNLKKVSNRCKNCGHALTVEAFFCRHCSDKNIINRYHADYIYTPELKTVIKQIKYQWRLRGAKQLGHLCSINPAILSEYDMGVPVPYHIFRYFNRMVQPVNIISKSLAKKGLQVDKILTRIKDTRYQSRLSKAKRFENVKNVFSTKYDLKGKKILLIDDLLTTGATVLECAKVLQTAGAKLIDVYTLITGISQPIGKNAGDARQNKA